MMTVLEHTTHLMIENLTHFWNLLFKMAHLFLQLLVFANSNSAAWLHDTWLLDICVSQLTGLNKRLPWFSQSFAARLRKYLLDCMWNCVRGKFGRCRLLLKLPRNICKLHSFCITSLKRGISIPPSQPCFLVFHNDKHWMISCIVNIYKAAAVLLMKFLALSRCNLYMFYF